MTKAQKRWAGARQGRTAGPGGQGAGRGVWDTPLTSRPLPTAIPPVLKCRGSDPALKGAGRPRVLTLGQPESKGSAPDPTGSGTQVGQCSCPQQARRKRQEAGRGWPLGEDDRGQEPLASPGERPEPQEPLPRWARGSRCLPLILAAHQVGLDGGVGCPGHLHSLRLLARGEEDLGSSNGQGWVGRGLGRAQVRVLHSMGWEGPDRERLEG